MPPARKDQIEHVPPSQLEANPFQYRPEMPPETLRELQESILEHGMLQPILVRPVKDRTHKGIYFQVVAGERRWYAAQAARLKTVPVIVRELTDSQAAEITLTENIQREDISDYATAKGLLALMETAEKEGNPLGIPELRRRLNKSDTWVRNRLNLFKLHPALQAVAEKKAQVLSSLHCIQKVKDSEQIEALAFEVENGAPFKYIEAEVKSILEERKHLRDSQSPPDAETATRAHADAHGGNTTSRGRQVTGNRAVEAREEVQRHLAGLEQWIPYLSPSNYQKLVVPFLNKHSLKSRQP